MCFVKVSSEMLYFKWFSVSKLGKLIFFDLAVSKFMDLIFMLFLPERLKLRNSCFRALQLLFPACNNSNQVYNPLSLQDLPHLSFSFLTAI